MKNDTIEAMQNHLETRQWVPFPIEKVFAFFADPSNLPRLMPPMLRSRIDHLKLASPPSPPSASDSSPHLCRAAAGMGSEIVLSFCPIPILPLRVSWTARIVEFVWNSYFVDEQVRGPFQTFRHRHGTHREIRDGIDGTVVTDSVTYVLPGGSLGKLGGGIVGRQLRQSFEYRQRRLPELLAESAWEAVERSQ